MLNNISFDLSHGYLSKEILSKKNESELDYNIIRQILYIISSLDEDKVECYHGCLPSETGSDMIFDYLILYRISNGFKPIFIKNGYYRRTSLHKCFKGFKSDDETEFNYYSINQLLDFVNEDSREKFYKFLEEKYNIIKQEILIF